jgi:transposase
MDAAGTTTWVGVDVAKETPDCCPLGPGERPRRRSFPNTPDRPFVPVRLVPDPTAEVVLPAGSPSASPCRPTRPTSPAWLPAWSPPCGARRANPWHDRGIYLAAEPQDGRKGIDGLAGVVTAALGRDPARSDLFVFKNRMGDRLKILAWQGDGFALYLRRLEQGTFAFPPADTAEAAITPAQLAMTLCGLDPADARRRRRYTPPA